VRLGAGHQSPDYQWWHGQPALDGDLIRLRDGVAQATRSYPSGRALAGGVTARADASPSPGGAGLRAAPGVAPR
jgi:hypothetical protein